MADDLKRVGIKLTADGAKDYKNALKECSAATKENYSELKLAQSQYDKNTSSTKKLEDRQKYLAQQTDVYKDKVKILNTQLKEMETAENRDEVAIAKKRSELNEAQSKLNGYEKSLQDVNKQLDNHAGKLKDWSDKLQTVGGKTKAVGDGMTKYVTAPIAAAGVASVAAFRDVDNGFDTVIQKTGATGQAAEGLKGVVRNLATEIPTDFETAGNAVGEVNTKFGLTGQALQDLSGQFIKFAQLNNTDVNTAIDGTQQALTAWGLSANDAGGFLDRVNLVAQQTGASVDSLISNTATSATAFQEMGLSVDGAVTFLGQLEMSGADSSAAMSGLQKALKNATKDGIPLDQALSNLQNTVKNGTGSVDGLTAAYDLFGKNGAQIYQAVQNGTLDFNNLAGAVENAGGSVSTTFNETMDPTDQFEMSMNRLKLTGYDIANSAMPMIESALTTLNDVLKDVNTWWNSLDTDTQQFIIKAALVVAAVGPILSIFGTLISTIGMVVGALAGLSAAFLPLLMGGAIIMGVVAAAALIVTNWDSIKAAAGRVAQGVGQKWNELKTSTGNLKEDLGRQWDNLKTYVGNAAEGLKQRASTAFSNMKTSISTTMENAKGIVSSSFERIKGFANFVWKLPELGMDLLNSVPDKVRGIVDRIKSLFDFKINFPHIPLPHFAWHWEDIGGVLSLPHFDGIQWYKKAYDRAAYYTTPTIRADGRGYGDRQGGEFAVGERHLRDVVREEVNRKDSPVNVVVNMTINGAPGQDVKELAEIVSDKLQATYEREKAAWA